MNTWTTKIAALLTAAALIFVAGMGLGWKLFRSKPVAQVAVAAPTIHQTDGSQVLEVKPDPHAKPAQQIPAGSHAVETVQVVVQPHPPATSGTAQPTSVNPAPSTGTAPAGVVPRPPVTVDLTLVRMPDRSQRVVASSPDGDVVGGIEIPIEVPEQPRELKWAVGAVYGLGEGGQTSKGMFLDRDVAFFRAGVEITRDTYSSLPAGWSGRLKLGFRF